MLAASQLSHPSPGATKGESLWKKAFDALDTNLQATLSVCNKPKLNILHQVLLQVENARQTCIRKQWRVKAPGGKTIILRDVVEKMAGWINRFKEVGTVAVQYDPLHGALPWAAFVFLLNVTLGDVQLFASLVTDLESIAFVLYRCGFYEKLYINTSTTTVDPLKESLVHLYAEILTHLSMSIKYFHKNTGSRIIYSAFGTVGTIERLKAIQAKEENLRKWTELADAQNAQQSMRATVDALHDIDSQVRRLADKATAQDKVIEELKMDEVVLWLSTVPFSQHQTERKRERFPGYDCWLIHDNAFKNWLCESSSSVFLLQGVPGCGKSMIFSSVVDHFTTNSTPNHVLATFAFFYCGGSSFEPERRSSESILRSLVRQLAVATNTNTIFQPVIDAYDKELATAKKWRTEPVKLGCDSCVSLIVEMLAVNPAYIGIDALDELEAKERAILVQALQSVVTQAANVVKIFITSRYDSHVEALLPSVTGVNISSTHNATDIKLFVENELRQAVDRKLLLNGSSPKLVSRISESLIAGAREMFLWAKLQLQAICKKKTEKDILDALDEGLSSRLDEIYGSTLQDILDSNKTSRQIVEVIFSTLLYAKKPLHPSAWRQMLDFEIDVGEMWDIDYVAICGNLILWDPSIEVFRFYHTSVQDFIRQQSYFSPSSAHGLLAKICLRQCSSPSDFLASAISSPIRDFYEYAAFHWPEHVRELGSTLPNIGPVNKELSQFAFTPDGFDISAAFFLWLENIRNTVEKLPPYHDIRYTLETIQSAHMSPIFPACVLGLAHWLSYMLENGIQIDMEQTSETGHTPLYLACAYGYQDVVSVLLKYGASTTTECGSFGGPLHVACYRGHKDVVDILLSHGASDRPSIAFESAFEAACSGGSENTARHLVEKGLPIHDEHEYNSVLQQAIEAGFANLSEWLALPKTVTRYISKSNAVNDHQSALIVGAIQRGNVQVLKGLLRSRPQLESMLPADGVAMAAQAGHADMVSFLLGKGLDPHVKGSFGTALRCACATGNERVLRALLIAGVDAKISADVSLHVAAQNGHVGIIKILLDEGVDVDLPTKHRGTSLHAACSRGHTQTVKSLLDHGADMYKKGKHGDALQTATKAGHADVAAYLLEKDYVARFTPSRPARDGG